MITIGPDCLLKNTDLAAKIKELLPIINLEVGARNGKPTFRQVRKELIKQTGVDIDLDTFADMYKSEIAPELRFTSDEQIEEILNVRTKAALEKLINGAVDRVEGVGETSTDRAAINKAAAILATIEGKDKSVKTKTLSRIVKDAVLSSIQRLANTDPNYKELKTKNQKLSYEETIQKVLEINSLQTSQIEPDKFNTIQDVMDQARESVLKSFESVRDENGEEILGDEALDFLDKYKDAFFGVMMSTTDANTLIRGALLDAGFGKGPQGSQTVDWKKLAGTINSPEVLKENVIKALVEKSGVTQETAESIANSLTTDFKDLVQSQKAMNVKYALAETHAKDILDKLGWDLSGKAIDKVNSEIRDAVDESVATSDELNISEIVANVLVNNGVSESQISNLPEKGLVLKSNVADRIAKIVKEDGELDAEALAALYKTLGKVVDDEAINELRRLSQLKEKVENIELQIDNPDGTTSKLSATKQGIEKAKAIKTISDQMARVVANSVDYSDKTWFSKMLTHSLNFLSKYLSANSALVLLNPFNLTQNILSGSFVGTQAKIGGAVSGLFGHIKTPLIYKNEKGEKINLTNLLNATGKFDTWFNTLAGAEGRDIPDLFTGDASKDVKTFQNAETKGDYIEATLTALPRAALTATDAMLKEPFFRKELIRGVLYHLQASGGKTKKEAQDLVYEALTKNTPENLAKQATQLASMVGKGKDKFYVKQLAEDIQLSSLVILDEDGRSLLSEQSLQSIIDAAKQTSGEAFGHRIQKNVFVLQWVYDLMSGARAKAIEGINKDFGEKMADLYKRGEYGQAAWEHFTHTLKTTMGFLFQRGIYNWAILTAQKNPISIITGFKQLAKQTNFYEQKESQAAVENYLRARAKIGRGVLGTATALAVAPLIMKLLGGEDDEERKANLAALRKDPVWGRMFNNYVSPLAQMLLDANLAENNTEVVGKVFRDMLIKPVVSAGSKYYSTDNLIQTTVDYMEQGRLPSAGIVAGGIFGQFLPGRGFLSTNKSFAERLAGKDSPEMVDENYQIVYDDRKPQKAEDFWDAFWYSSLFKSPK